MQKFSLKSFFMMSLFKEIVTLAQFGRIILARDTEKIKIKLYFQMEKFLIVENLCLQKIPVTFP